MSMNVIQTRSLTLSYKRDVPVVLNLGLDVAEGEFIALLGPSGCGKTTLLRFLAGLLKPGEIIVEGQATVTGLHPSEGEHLRGGKVGFVFEHPSLLPWRRVLDNGRLGLDIRGNSTSDGNTKVQELMQSVGLKEYVNFYPDELSLGMQQRVALVRCLAYEPGVILLDTPFSGIDSQTKLEMLDLVSHLMFGEKTILFVTHDVSEAVTLADRVIVLTSGPAQVKSVVDVGEKRPRDVRAFRQSEAFAMLEREVWLEVLRDDLQK